MSDRLRLLVVSHILPVPGSSGQQQRVRYTLEAARPLFHVTLLTYAPAGQQNSVRAELSAYCDASVILPSLYSRTRTEKWRHRIESVAYALATGEKRSNYAMERVEFAPVRVAEVIGESCFDVALFEYWHASGAASVFRNRSIPSVLDMHNVLWKAYDRQLSADRWLPRWLRHLAVERYRRREEQSWREFDGVVAINREEEAYVRGGRLRPGAHVFYAPMGVDLGRWPYGWRPERPVRIGFYGGLGSPENQDGALRCHQVIMPRVWQRFPDAELWLVGSDPSPRLQALSKDPRVKVTGFVRDVAETLTTMSCVVCPWSGTYGFRSRLVEVMSLGVPTVASRDAVRGMELEHRGGVLLADDDEGLARLVLELLEDEAVAREQGWRGRARIEKLFTVANTYGRWMGELKEWLLTRGKAAA